MFLDPTPRSFFLEARKHLEKTAAIIQGERALRFTDREEQNMRIIPRSSVSSITIRHLTRRFLREVSFEVAHEVKVAFELRCINMFFRILAINHFLKFA